jgi:hypothetical protein
MYAAQKLADGILNSSDLPDNVTVNGTSFSLSGTGYGNTTNGVILEGNVWAKYTNGVRSSRPCLIQGGVEDQFADTYYYSATDTFPFPDDKSWSNVPLHRVSLCRWQESDETGAGVLLYVVANSSGRDLWRVGGIGIDGTVPSPEGIRLNTPVGAYLNRFLFANITVTE